MQYKTVLYGLCGRHEIVWYVQNKKGCGESLILKYLVTIKQYEWNYLPFQVERQLRCKDQHLLQVPLTSLKSLAVFTKRLKTYLFTKVYMV